MPNARCSLGATRALRALTRFTALRLVALTACAASPATSPGPDGANSGRPAVAEASSTVSDAPPAPVPAVSPGPLEIEIVGRAGVVQPTDIHPPEEVGMSDHPFAWGWSQAYGNSGPEFLECRPGGGMDCDVCTFHRPGLAKSQAPQMRAGSECEPPRTGDELDRRLAGGDFRVVDDSWKFGGSHVIVVEQTRGAPDAQGDPRAVVRIGVRPRNGEQTRWIETFERCFDHGENIGIHCAPDMHVDVLAPSPDGRDVGVLLHSFMGEFTDTYEVRVWAAESLVASR